MIKMFASDLDGTLLNALHEADGTIRRAIRELTEAGLHVVPATGRSTLPVGEHGFTGLALDACCSNGSIVRDSHGEVLKTWTIDPQVTEELLKEFPDICFDCFDNLEAGVADFSRMLEHGNEDKVDRLRDYIAQHMIENPHAGEPGSKGVPQGRYMLDHIRKVRWAFIAWEPVSAPSS